MFIALAMYYVMLVPGWLFYSGLGYCQKVVIKNKWSHDMLVTWHDSYKTQVMWHNSHMTQQPHYKRWMTQQPHYKRQMTQQPHYKRQMTQLAHKNTSQPGSRDSSVVRVPDVWSKGCMFKSPQERCKNSLLQGQLSVLTHILVSQ